MKLMIDIPEWQYDSICEGIEASKRCGVVGIDPTIHEAIAQGTSVSTEGDLINRSALKKSCAEVVMASNNSDFIPCPTWNKAMELIDNAPTVPLPDFKEGYKQAIRDGKTNFSKQQGEWIGDTDYESCQGMYERYKCSECGYGIDWRKHNQLMCQDEIPEEYREYYCPHCGSKII